MPTQIQDVGPTTALRHLLRTVGRIVPRLDDTIVPVVVVGEVSGELPPGVPRRCAAQGNQAAVAGENAYFRFEAPPGTAAIIRRIYVSASVRDLLLVAWGSQVSPAPATLATGQFMDGRRRGSNAFPGPIQPSCRLGFDTQVANIVQTLSLEVPLAPAIRGYDVDWALGGLEGQFDFVEIMASTDSSQLRLSLVWDEWPGVVSTL